ncbi:MAG TPA: PfkB family carbohydrate kinase [Puia sp.]|jgi:rfaE bifunctional protein kinase chain/domain|nr:PfkB family carbohydrate kinase [Puia sp.]
MSSSVDYKELFKTFSSVKIGVIGDMMLDTYWWGNVERISPEAPVPVVTVNRKEYRIGGAGNVALNLASLGTPVSVFSVIGDDDDGQILTGLLNENKIDTVYLLKSANRITTNKMRVISRNQQMMRLDSETLLPLDNEQEQKLIGQIERFIREQSPAAIIFEDYNKGVLTEKIIHNVIEICRKNSVITSVDPKRKHFFEYRGVDIFKPNLKEAREALNLLIDEINQNVLAKIHQKLLNELNHRISFITLSEKGVFYEDGKESHMVPSHIRNVADVSGAGDTVIAVATLIYALTRNTKMMAEIANLAGGLVCESVGTVAIDKSKLLRECQRLLIEK